MPLKIELTKQEDLDLMLAVITAQADLQGRIKIFDEVAHKQQIASCFSSFETLESIRQKLDNAFLASELDYETP